MTPDEIIRYILSFLGGGVVAAIGNWIYSTRAARRQNEIQHLLNQLKDLYGPVYFFTSQNEQLFGLCDDVHDAYSTHFGQNWSPDARTQETLSKQAGATIDLGNAYVQQAVENNDRVMEVLRVHWHLVDDADVPVLSQFQVDHTRFTAEVKNKQAQGVPFAISQMLGSISYMRPEMIKAVKNAVVRKRGRLKELGGSSHAA
jgi:hypothetical protein